MDNVLAKFKALTDAIRRLLRGEPLRFISYGSAVVIYAVSHVVGPLVGVAFGDVSFFEALGQATSAAAVVVAVTEFARNYVSPAE